MSQINHKQTLALPEAVGHRTNVGQEPGKPVYHAPQPLRKLCDWREDPDSGQYIIKKIRSE